MKLPILLFAAVAILPLSCASPPPVSGTLVHRLGSLRVLPDGSFEVAVAPIRSK